MKSHKFLFSILTILAITFTSCDAENDELIPEQVLEENTESIDLQSKSSISQTQVGRYYSGGGNTLHTYKVANVGTGIGTFEGRPFKLGLRNTPASANPPSGTSRLYFLLAPGNRDFLLTTSSQERSNVLRRGWRDLSTWSIYNYSQSAVIYRSGGSGRVKLYRFYNSPQSDHLFTTNYHEGVNAGLTYEGVVGYVYR